MVSFSGPDGARCQLPEKLYKYMILNNYFCTLVFHERVQY